MTKQKDLASQKLILQGMIETYTKLYSNTKDQLVAIETVLDINKKYITHNTLKMRRAVIVVLAANRLRKFCKEQRYGVLLRCKGVSISNTQISKTVLDEIIQKMEDQDEDIEVLAPYLKELHNYNEGNYNNKLSTELLGEDLVKYERGKLFNNRVKESVINIRSNISQLKDQVILLKRREEELLNNLTKEKILKTECEKQLKLVSNELKIVQDDNKDIVKDYDIMKQHLEFKEKTIESSKIDIVKY